MNGRPDAASPCFWPPRVDTGYTGINMQRLLIALGTVLLAAGLLWPWLAKLGLGRLPGDIFIDRPGVKFYFPLVTMLALSVLISLILWLFRR